MSRYIRGLLSAVTLSLVASIASAAQIKVTFSGVGSGAIGENSFTDQHFEFELFGDSDLVFNPLSRTYVLPTSTGSLTVSGLGTSSIDNLFPFLNGENSLVGIGTDDQGNASLYYEASAFSCEEVEVEFLPGEFVTIDNCYKFDTNFGPVAGTGFTPFAGSSITTSNGVASFSAISSGVFSATVVPVPAAVWLFGSALMGLWRFKARSAS